jgi:hypothetical protein
VSHANRFIAAARSKEGASRLAEIGLGSTGGS